MRYVYLKHEITCFFTLRESLSWIAYREYAVEKDENAYISSHHMEDEFWEDKYFDEHGYPTLRTLSSRDDGLDDKRMDYLLDNDVQEFWKEVFTIRDRKEKIARNELLASLMNGSLIAYGINKDDSKSIDIDEKLKHEYVGDITKEQLSPIPQDFWDMDEIIDWEHCFIKQRNSSNSYIHIRIFTDDLFSLYPEPLPQDFIAKNEGLEKRGNCLVSRDENKLAIPAHSKATKVRKRAGRPQEYNWDGFKVELTRYILEKGGLPRLQKDLENHMLEWCQDTWENEPTLSAVRTAIQPYYKSGISKIREAEFAS